MKLLNIAALVATLIALFIAIWPGLTGSNGISRTTAIACTLVFLVLTIAIYRFNHQTETDDSTMVQEGTIRITEMRNDQLEVFYPKKYQSVPNLNFEMGRGTDAEVRLIDQRSDGFVFSVSNISHAAFVGEENASVKWIAEGSK